MGGLSALWRGHGLKEFQPPHRDGDVASFNVVEVLTNKYGIKIWKGSHLLPFWKRENPPLVTGYGTNVNVNMWEIIIFHSTLIHCGGMSCQDKENFVVRQKQFERINKTQLNAIKWFDLGKNSDKIAITDMSVHYTVEPVAAQYNDTTHKC